MLHPRRFFKKEINKCTIMKLDGKPLIMIFHDNLGQWFIDFLVVKKLNEEGFPIVDVIGIMPLENTENRDLMKNYELIAVRWDETPFYVSRECRRHFVYGRNGDPFKFGSPPEFIPEEEREKSWVFDPRLRQKCIEEIPSFYREFKESNKYSMLKKISL